MKRILLALCVVAVFVGCPKKEHPGPTPEPTPVVEPLPTPAASVAACKTDVPGSYPRCKDVDGNLVTCPVETNTLPDCQ